LPNVFTALADVGLGWLCAVATGTPWSRWPALLALLVASASLYSAGMVWNDFFDIEQDRRERPFRPLPSGRVCRRDAAALAAGLLAAFLSGIAEPAATSALPIPLVLVVAILLYDAWLKRTWAGPLAMGACRFLNILLGLSVATSALGWGARAHLATVVGVYI